MKYDAFISYRHADLDLYIAKKVHKSLETFQVPRAVAKKTGKKSIKRVFRDQEELPIGSDLGDNIETALSESEYLIVICSPRTPQSYWVQKEIDTFIGMHGREKVLAVLIEGEPDESFPPQLLTDDEGNPVEPLAADVRGASKGEIGRKMKTEIMRLAAPLLGCSYDDLKQRHRERKIKRMAAAAAVVAAFAVAFGAYNAYNAALIQQNYEGKQKNQSKYLADTSLSLLEDGDRRAAVLVALEALPSKENDRPYVAEAQYALSEALYVYDTGAKMKMDRALAHDLPVDDFSFHEDGTKVVSVDRGGSVYVWDLENGGKLAQIRPKADENGYLSKPVKALLCEEKIIICEEDQIRSVSYDGEEIWQAEYENVIYCEYNENTQTVACISNDFVFFYDAVSGAEVGRMVNSLPHSYTSSRVFSDDDTKFAVSHLNTEETVPNGFVSIYDFETKTVTTVHTANSFIADMDFDKENYLFTASSPFSGNFESSELTDIKVLEKIDWENYETLWEDSFTYQKVGTNAVSAKIICRYYQDDAGEVHDDVMVSVDNMAYTWKNETGERVAEVAVDGGIIDFMAASQASYGYLAQNNGDVAVVSMESGTRYDSATIETGKLIKQAFIRNGMLVVRSYESPALTVMKYPKAAEVVTVDECDDTVMDMQVSPEETYYAVEVAAFDIPGNISFYRTDDNSKINQWLDEERYVELSGFVDDETYMIVSTDGSLIFYQVATGEIEIMELTEGSHAAEFDVNADNSLLIGCKGNEYFVVDLKKREVLVQKEVEQYLYGAVLSDDGKKAYCNTQEDGLCILDTESGKMTPVTSEEYQILRGLDVQNAFADGAGGRLLAVSCSDGMLRVLDLQEMQTVAEIPFTGMNHRFVRFSDDGKQIMMQGDDYYLRVYDLEEQAFCYIATGQYYHIEKVIADDETGTLSLITTADMVLVNAEDYERIAQVEGGKAYLPESGKIYSSSYKTVYQFPYMTLEMLQEEAISLFGDERLSDAERVRFHVE